MKWFWTFIGFSLFAGCIVTHQLIGFIGGIGFMIANDYFRRRRNNPRLEAAEKIVVSYAYHSVASKDFDAWRKLAGK